MQGGAGWPNLAIERIIGAIGDHWEGGGKSRFQIGGGGGGSEGGAGLIPYSYAYTCIMYKLATLK